MTDAEIAALEARLSQLPRWEWRLEAQARYIERLPEAHALTGELQGEALHIAALIRQLAKKLAA